MNPYLENFSKSLRVKPCAPCVKSWLFNMKLLVKCREYQNVSIVVSLFYQPLSHCYLVPENPKFAFFFYFGVSLSVLPDFVLN